MNKSISKIGHLGAFSLIELLVVVALIGILLGITLPSFMNMGEGLSMQTAVQQLTSTLSLARQWAIAHREETSVVFVDDGVVDSSPIFAGNREHIDKAFRAYGVYTKRDGYLKEWSYLPEGVIFDADPVLSENPFDPSVNASMEVPFPDNDGDGVTLPAITFKPNGSVRPGKHLKLFLTEGWVDLDLEAGRVNEALAKSNGITNSMTVQHLTGQVRINQHY